jgi:hypothetical protein
VRNSNPTKFKCRFAGRFPDGLHLKKSLHHPWVLSQHLSEGTRKTYEKSKSGENSWSPGGDLRSGSPEYKVGVMPHFVRISVQLSVCLTFFFGGWSLLLTFNFGGIEGILDRSSELAGPNACWSSAMPVLWHCSKEYFNILDERRKDVLPLSIDLLKQEMPPITVRNNKAIS